MSSEIRYRIDPEVKSGYTQFIEDNFEHKHGKCGKSIENLMKFHLALHGHEKYHDDPDVLELLDRVGGSFTAHTHNISKKGILSENVIVDLVEEIKSLKAEVKQLRSEVKGKPSKKTGSMSEFKKQFKTEFNGAKQVSRWDITRFVTDNEDVHDSRTIQNRINYLLAHEVLELSAPNVFNVKF